MAPETDLSAVRRRARLAYEWGRARRALAGAVPVVALAALAVVFGDRPSWSLAFGTAVFITGVSMLFYGRQPQRAFLPGLAAGILPIALVLCARHVGHACSGIACTTLCLQACAAGGILAGLAVSSVGAARRAGPTYWLAASMVAVLTGAMACGCVGIFGLGGLAIGYAAGAVPGLLGRTLSAR